METFPVVSIDSERTLRPAQGETPDNFVQVAFGHSCRAVIFHLHHLRQERTRAGVVDALSEGVMDTLPPRFRLEVLCHPNIYKLVSGLSEEKGTFGSLTRMVDVQAMYCDAIPPEEVCPSARSKRGLAIIGMAANGYTHKPHIAKTPQASQALLAEWTGMSPYPGEGWPRWRNHGFLYSWTCGTRLNDWYMVQDVWTPLAFLFMVLRRKILDQPPFQSAQPLVQVALSTLEPYAAGTVPSSMATALLPTSSAASSNATPLCAAPPRAASSSTVPLHAVPPCAASSSTISSSAMPLHTAPPRTASSSTTSSCAMSLHAVLPRAPTSSAAPFHVSASCSAPSRPSKRHYRVGSPSGPVVSRSFTEQDPDVLVLDLQEEDRIGLEPEAQNSEPPSKRRKKKTPRAVATKWNLTLAEENGAVILPEWGKKCGACGYTGHTFRFYSKGVVCPTILNKPKGEFLCTYSPCKRKGLHTTRVCPTLHALCGVCGCRGHFSGCNPTSETWMAEALQTFEASADQGVWTSLRSIRTQWGFFPVAFEQRKNDLRDYKGCLFPNLPRPYSYFLRRPVLETLEALRQYFGGRPRILRRSLFLPAVNADDMQRAEMNRPEGHEIF